MLMLKYTFAVLFLCLLFLSPSSHAATLYQDSSELDWSLLQPITAENISQLTKLYCVKLGEGYLHHLDTFSDGEMLLIAFATDNDELYLLKLYPSHADTILLETYTEIIRNLALSPEGDLLAAIINRVGIDVWEVSSEEKLITLGESQPNAITFHPTTSVLIAAESDQIVQWDIQAGTQTTLFDLFDVPIESLAFTPSDNKLAVGHMMGAFLFDWQDDQQSPISGIDMSFVFITDAYGADLIFNEEGTALSYTSDGYTKCENHLRIK